MDFVRTGHFREIATERYLCSEGGKKGIFVDSLCWENVIFVILNHKKTTKIGASTGTRENRQFIFENGCFWKGSLKG